MKSEFGKGFIYPLALYMMHLERMLEAKTYMEFCLAVDGAFDHIRYLNIPIDLPKKISKDIEYLINRLQRYKYRSGNFRLITRKITKVPKDGARIISQSKKIFFDIDKYYLKANPIRGEYE